MNGVHIFFILFAGICGVLLPNITMHYIISKYGVGKIESFYLLVPLLTAILAFFILKESMNLMTLIGGLIILLGLYIVNLTMTD